MTATRRALSARPARRRARTARMLGMLSLVGAVIRSRSQSSTCAPPPALRRAATARRSGAPCRSSPACCCSPRRAGSVDEDIRWERGAERLTVMMVVPPCSSSAPRSRCCCAASPRAPQGDHRHPPRPGDEEGQRTRRGIGLTLEYHGTMFLVMLTGWYGFALRRELAHVLAHSYLFLCGLLFWMPLIGPTPPASGPAMGEGRDRRVGPPCLRPARPADERPRQRRHGCSASAGRADARRARTARDSGSRQAGRPRSPGANVARWR